MGGLARVLSLSFSLLLVAAVCGAGACELVLTQAEYSADRSRAVEFTGFSSIFITVSGAGDVNGDGFEDFAIADSTATSGSFNSAGVIYVVFGRSAADWANASFDFSTADPPNTTSWIRIKGTADNMNLGKASIAHGDFNGDGLSDILISTDLSEVFCVYGRGGAWSSFATTKIGLYGAPGFSINGGSIGTKRYAGNAGDMNGDGIEDIIVSDEVAGMAYIIFGEAGTSRSAFDVITVDGTNGFSVDDGAISTGNCANLGSAGDVNGDGLADLVLGSKGALNGYGRAYVLFARNVSEVGQWSDSTKLSTDLDGANGFVVSGPASSNLGWVAVGAGDVNSDGFADIFIGSESTSGAWVVFGHPTPWTSLLDASLLNGTDGFHVSGSAEMWGYSGGGVGDFNSDGIDDILLSGYEAFDSNSDQTGAAAIIFGHGGAWPAELSRADFVGSVGFLVDGPSIGSYFGWSARGAGDVNGDGHADFLVAAPNNAFALLVFGVADDHCAMCSNTTDECLACEDRFFLNSSSLCEACSDSNCRTCTSPIVCTACDDGFYLDAGACDSCSIISSCITCNSASDCTTCVVGYFASGSGTCQACSVHCFTCTSSSNCTDCEDGFVLVNGFCEEVASSSSSSSSSSASASSSAAVVVVIETGGGGNAIEVAAEIAQLLGVDVGQISVVEITPGTFEVTVINEEVAQQLVTLVEQCIEDALQAESSSEQVSFVLCVCYQPTLKSTLMVKVKRGALLLRDGDGKWVEHRAVAKLRSPPHLVLSLQSNNGSASVVALKVRVATVEATSADGGFCVTARTAGGDAGATTELRAAPKPAKGRSAADVRDSWLRFLRRTPPPPKQKHHRHTKTDGAAASASAAVDNGDSHPPSYSPVDTSLPSTPLQARRGPLLQRSAEETQSTGALLPAAAAPTPLVSKPIVAADEDEEGDEDAAANSPPRTPRRGALWKSMVEGPPATAPRPATHGPTGGADEAAVASPTPLRRTHSDESMLELTPMTAAAAEAAASKQQHRRRRTRVGDVAGLQPVLLGDAARVWHSEHPDEPAPTVAKKWRRSQHYGAHAGHGGHRMPVKQFKVNEMGEIIYKSHPSWVLMHQMQIGIRHCIVNERLREEEVALLRSPGYWHRSEFFSTPEIIRFPAAGSEDTVRHALGDFKFKNYMPLVFRYARGIFGIERSDYVASLCHSTERDENPLRLMATPGKSGSLFFFSQDMRFLIKTIPKSEARLLRSIMPPYIEHITRNPNTLLPRFYGLHRVKPHRGRQVRFVIMANNFATGLKIHERFDLKGSMLGRYVSPAERAIKGRNATLKEGNLAELGRILSLGSGRRERFLSQLHKDAEFLRDLGIMDYSLLVGIHYDAVAQKEKGKEAAIAAAAAAMASTSPAPPAAPAAAPSYTVTDLTSTSAASSTSKSAPSAEQPPAPSSPRPQAPFPRESTESERLRPEFFTMGVDLQPQAATVQRAIEADIVSLPISDQLLTIEHDDLRPVAAAPSEWYCEEGGMAGRDAEGRPVGEHYFLGVIDILMFYTARKAAERMYKTLRYRGKGEVSSCPPAQYADRFVRYISSIVQ